MLDMLPEIRNAARALIVREAQLLVLRKTGGERGDRFALPGGAQDAGETLQQALNRECIEEIGTPVEIGELVQVADFFKLRDTRPPTRRHLVEFLFRCNVPPDYQPHNGVRPDKHQVDVVWVPLAGLASLNLFPPFLSTSIPQQLARSGRGGRYLGAFEDDATAKGH